MLRIVIPHICRQQAALLVRRGGFKGLSQLPATLFSNARQITRSVAASATNSAAMAAKVVQFERIGGPEVLEVKEVPIPTPTAGAVLVKNEVAGVNFIDTYHRSGVYKLDLPSGIGKDGAGVVEAVGPGVETLKVGDRVAYVHNALGSYATHVAVPAGGCAKLPDDISFEQGATAMIQGLTAWAFVTRACEGAPREGDWVLVHAAAGGTGQLLTQVAAQRGARVIAMVSTEAKAEIARGLGAEEVVLYTSHDVPTEVARITGGKGVTVVYDGVGKDTFDASLGAVAPFGWLLSFGNASGVVEGLDILRLAPKNVRLMRPQLFGFIPNDENFAEISGEVLAAVGQGKLKLSVHPTAYRLEDAAKAHEDLHGRRTTGKLLLRPS